MPPHKTKLSFIETYMKTHLEFIFSNVNEWLKFAEAKAATLLAADGVVIFGLIGLLKDIKLGYFTSHLIFISIISFSISLFICLSSFIPTISIPLIHKKWNRTSNDNLIFFGHIENYTPTAYLTEIRKHFNIVEVYDSKFCAMLAQQIIVNSSITSYKFSVFKKSMWFTLFGVFTSFVSCIIHVWN